MPARARGGRRSAGLTTTRPLEAQLGAPHQEVARRLAERPEIVDRAHRRVKAWLGSPLEHPYARDWQELLDLDVDGLVRALADTSDRMCTLRQASPFAGALDSRTRWQVLEQAELRPNEAR